MSTSKHRLAAAVGVSALLILSVAALDRSRRRQPPGRPRSAASGPAPRPDGGSVHLTIQGREPRQAGRGCRTEVARQDHQLHRTVMDSGGMMSMKPYKSIPVPASGTVKLKPGGYHVMLIGLKKHLVAGATFPLTLTFATAGKKTVTVTVRKG